MLVFLFLLSYYDASATNPPAADIARAVELVVLFILFSPTKSLRPDDVPRFKMSVDLS